MLLLLLLEYSASFVEVKFVVVMVAQPGVGRFFFVLFESLDSILFKFPLVVTFCDHTFGTSTVNLEFQLVLSLFNFFVGCLRFLTLIGYSFVFSFEIKALLDHSLGRLIFPCIVFEEVNLNKLFVISHLFQRLASCQFPLVDVPNLAGQVRLVHLIDDIKSVFSVAQQKQEFMGQQEPVSIALLLAEVHLFLLLVFHIFPVLNPLYVRSK